MLMNSSMGDEQQMNLIKSHSGVRGIYGEQLKPGIAYKIANKFAEQFKLEKVVIGRDTRSSGEPIKHAVISGLIAAGTNVIDVNIAPTPAILYAIKKFRANGGIIISASHNPPEWNAIKIAGRNGTLLTSNEVDRILTRINEEEYISSKPGRIIRANIISEYLEKLMNCIDIDLIREGKFKVVIDAGGGAGSLSTPKLLSKLGCKVISINSTPGIFTRKIEPTGEALEELKLMVKSTRADVGFAHDCDADRLACVDDKGRAMSEDYGIAVAVNHELSKTRNKKLVVNISSSNIFREIAEKQGAKLYWSPVGEANVVSLMMKVDSDIGAEGSSGGFILRKFHLARDGALAAAKILEAMAETGKSLSQIIDEMPKYYTIKRTIEAKPKLYGKIREALIKKWSREAEVILIDGVKIATNEWWILVRPSKTEPKIRIIAEAKTQSKAIKLVKECMELVKQ